MIPDSSAWIEYVRDRDSPAKRRLRAARLDDLVITDPVMLELLAGARDPNEHHRVKLVVGACQYEPVHSIEDWEDAAALYRLCRAGGETVRSKFDCLIAAVAIRLDVPILHNDRDFDVLARHTPLRVVDA